MSNEQRSNLNYEIGLNIKDKDFKEELTSVRIISSIDGAYQIVELSMSVDANDIILNSIYGQEPIKLQVKLLGTGGINNMPIEHTSFELMYVDSKSSLTSKSSLSEGKSPDRTMVNIITVTRKPFIAMHKIINDVFIGKNPTEIVTEIVSSTDCELVLDKEDKNTQKIRQVCIPPMILYKAIEYLDSSFGLYNGASNLGFCQYDNKFYVMNLSKRIKKSQIFTIYHLSTDSGDVDKIFKKSADGKNFYTNSPLISNYSGNTIFAAKSETAHIIMKPFNDLFTIKDYKTSDICKDYGANNSADPMFHRDKCLNAREEYITNEPGYENSELSIAGFSRKIINMSTLKIELGKNLPINNLLRVGEPVKLDVKTVEYMDLSGMYLLHSSDISLRKVAAGWISNVSVSLMRTNKTI